MASTSLVGRQAELQMLRHAWNDVASQRQEQKRALTNTTTTTSAGICLQGPAGVGKSALEPKRLPPK